MRAHETLVDDGRVIDVTSPAEQLHELRKTAKTLRYLFECFGSLLPAEPRRAFVKRLMVLQDNLGVFQDAQVHAEQLREIVATLPPQGTSTENLDAAEQLAASLDRQRARARVEFADRFATYDGAATTEALHDALAGVSR